MAMFVHLTPASRAPAIRRNGIRRSPAGVFAMPVTRNFHVSHQWLRELRRRGTETVVAVYFRIPDGEVVWVGRYNQPHRRMSAAEAVAAFLNDVNTEGWEVIVPRRIAPKEIHRFRGIPQIVGWRFYPESKGKRPCPCPYCTKGDRGARKIRSKSLPRGE